ncbi:Phenylalanine/tyrosine ammonia-lyase [Podospora aff. communis PSN243]|uniref:Phenylalanine/tyrosine ammonia-lyase n=1 Tax=Podospora aff. communis PSN243 TaxID=3040156 RepID=A0AAV9GG27_9PEZI|nr:Phenylalanine/tyrosine ammonia-lyase [Podospora aff. communis PSN243]
MHGACSPHARAVHGEWSDLRAAIAGKGDRSVNGQDLSIAQVIAVSCHGATARLTDAPEVLDLVNRSVAFLESELKDGRVIYGVNTGFGGSADTRTDNFERLQDAAIQHLNVGILLQTDKDGSPRRENDLLRSHALPTPIVKAAMLIRCNSLMRGHSGVRVSVIDTIMQLLARDMTPIVPLRGSISASGDLSTLSYIAGAIEGNPDVFIKLGKGNDQERKILPASQVLSMAGLTPVRLQAKEGLGITNGTAPSCAVACIVVHQANQLALLTQLLTAMGTEALAGTSHNYHPFISAARPHAGQAEAASNILKFITGSKLSPDRGPEHIGLAQDRYALRTAPQWIGPQLEDLLLATRQVATEVNSTTDNPLIDVASGRAHHGGNFQAMAITSAMEKTMTALQNLGRLLFAQSSELINNMTNKGLPPNLSADEPSESFTFKGFDVNMAAYMAELAYLAHPVSTHVQVAEMTNQSVNSMALAAARYALEAVEVLSLMAATYICALCQALDLRCMQVEFRQDMVRRIADAGSVFFGAEPQIFAEYGEAVMQRWDQLSHADTSDRAATAAKEAMGGLMEAFASIPNSSATPSLEKLLEFQRKTLSMLIAQYNEARQRLFENPTTEEFLSPASRVIYEFVRKDLRVPLNRGVVDHPPLLLRSHEWQNSSGLGNGSGTNEESNGAATNGTGSNGNIANGTESKKTDLIAHTKILGTMASEIYEAVRSGELHDRIMKFTEDFGFWVE